METILLDPTILEGEYLSDLTQEVQDFKPYLIKNVLLLSPGTWNGKVFTSDSIKNGFQKTDWSDKKNYELIYSHDEKAENWVGNVINRVLSDDGKLYGDLEIYDKDLAIKLGKGKAKLGISAKILGDYNEDTNIFNIEKFSNFSVVYNPACKEAFINLSDGGVVTSVSSEGTSSTQNVNRPIDYGEKEKLSESEEFKSSFNEMLQDEKSAPSKYSHLKSLTENMEIKNKIDSIIPDEERHYKILMNLKDSLNLEEDTESLAKVTDMEGMRKRMGMSVSEFYAIPMNPPSASKLPMFDANHVRNALARINQIKGVSQSQIDSAKRKLMSKAKKFGIDSHKDKKEENMKENMENNEVIGKNDSEELNSKLNSILDAVVKLSERLDVLESQKVPTNPVQKIIGDLEPAIGEKKGDSTNDKEDDSDEDDKEKEEDKEDKKDEEKDDGDANEVATTKSENKNSKPDSKEKLSQTENLSEKLESALTEIEKLKAARSNATSRTVLLSKESLGKGARNFTPLEMNLLQALTEQVK